MAHDPEPIAARSWLFAPGDSERKMEKAIGGDADAVIFDLEDAVSTDRKGAARDAVSAMLDAHPDARARIWVRINPLDTDGAVHDLAAVMRYGPAGIMLPKPRGRNDADRLHHHLTALEAAFGIEEGRTGTFLLATETPESTLSIGDYAGTPRLSALSWGAEDLATALGASDNTGPHGGYGFTYEMARSLCHLAASAAGVPAIETIHGDFRDLDGLKSRAETMARGGWAGMLAIHPAQVDVINDAFSPSKAEIDRAEAVIAAFAADPGAGTVGLDGEMLDRPHLLRAERLLARANVGHRDG